MKTILATALLAALATPALAQGRPSTLQMSCGQAEAVVNQRGAIVLATGRDLYDRYVKNGSFCPISDYPRDAFVPTRDNPQCHIGYYCTSTPPLFSR